MAEILDKFQKEVLKEMAKSKLSSHFVWSGGTALSYNYLQHRLSIDLDFLSQDLLPDEYLLSSVMEIKERLKIGRVKEQKRFNRHEFWLQKNKEALKIEFVFYPFPFIKAPKKVKEFGVKVDSIEDILTNKTHALFERSEPKDVFDIFWILRKEKIEYQKIFKWVKEKFGVEIDPVIFSSKALEAVAELKEIQLLLLNKKLFVPEKMKNYFELEAQKYLRKKVK